MAYTYEGVIASNAGYGDIALTVSGATPGNFLVATYRTNANNTGNPPVDATGNWTLAAYADDTFRASGTFYRIASGDANDNFQLTVPTGEHTIHVDEFAGIAVPIVLNPSGNGEFKQGTTGVHSPIVPDDSDPSLLYAASGPNYGDWTSDPVENLAISSGFTRAGSTTFPGVNPWEPSVFSAHRGASDTAAQNPVWTTTNPRNIWHFLTDFGVKEATAGPPPGEDMAAAVSGAASILATLSPVRLFNAAVSGAASVAATLSRVALLGASISGTAAVAGTLETFPAGAELAASVSGDATVTATLEGFPVQPGAEMEAAVTGDAGVLATLLASGGLGGALEGTATVTATLSPAPGFAADVAGSASVTATLSGVPSLAASVAAGATVDATLAAAFGLSGILSGNSTAILEAPSQFRPRFAMTIDLSPLFEENEFSFTTIWNDQVTFLSILTDFYAESIGGINIAGTDPILIAEHSLIPQVREGDSIKIEDWEWVVREVMPSNTGIVRLKLETVT